MQPTRSFRLTRTEATSLDLMALADGEIVYDSTNQCLRLMNGRDPGGIKILRSDLANIKSTALNKSVNFGTGVVTASQFIGAGIGAVLGDTPPVAPVAQTGTLWFDTSSGKLYIYYNDGNSTQWVQPMTPSYSTGSGGGGSGTVNSGIAGKLAYYANNGTTVDDLAEVYWHSHDGASMLHIDGQIAVSAQKNYVRFHWDTLTDLNTEAPPGSWHGMVAHVHATGRLYVAHSGTWLPLAMLSDVAVTGIQAGTNVTVSSVGGVYTINAASGGGGGGITTEDAQDAMASLFSNGTQTGITFVYNDAGNALSATVGTVALGTGTSGNYVASVQTGSGITGGSAGFAGAAISLAIDTTVVSTLIGVQTLTNKTISGASNTITNIPNSALANNSVTINGQSVALGNAITISTASSLDNLTNVTITTPSTGQVLKYNGSRWINDVDATSGGAGVGTVTSVSVASANGFTGTVATASSTPSITIATSITGLLKGNGTAVSSAVAGTDYQSAQSVTGIVKSSGTTRSAAMAGIDYQAPIGTISGMVKGNGANAVTAAVSGTDYQAPITLTTTGSSGAATFSGGTLNIPQYVGSGGSGTVTTVSVASANGFAGSVTNATSTPAITITTSINGLIKGNGSAISAATSGTDYQAPITLTTFYSSGAATWNGTTLNIPQYSGGGATTFSGSTDATSAGLTVDEIYLPAITRLDVTANGASSYSFDQYASTNPTVYAISGTTIAFNLNVSGHPFLIQTTGGANYSTGLVHVSTSGVVSTGSSAQGQVTGTLYWKIPFATTGNYRYICSLHGSMVGTITIKDFATL